MNILAPLFSVTIRTPLGHFCAAATENALISLRFGEAKEQRANSILEQFTEELDAYFRQKSNEFKTPYYLAGTAFQKEVWEALATIPYGQTISYQQLAIKVGCPKACRAVANANGANPLPILIPCHRVIRSDGTLGGYNGGVEVKRALLDLESVPGFRK
jgi:methylated-DNA-[protein]-cysteine S-methyltransferase